MKVTNFLYSIIGVTGFILLWWAVKVLFFSDSIFLSPPLDTFIRLIKLLYTGGLLIDFSSTMYKFIAGYGIAVLIGVPVGFILGLFNRLYQSVELLLDFFRSIPVTTLFPLFILYFGISSKTIIAMVVAACIFVIILNTSYGVFYTKKSHVSYVESLGANKLQIFFHVIFPSSLPFIFVGLRTSVSFALIVVIVAEMFIGANDGLGIRVYEAHETYLVTDVYAIILFVGLIGYFFNKIFLTIENKIIHWK